MKRSGATFGLFLLLGLTGCAQVNDTFQDLRRAASEPAVEEPGFERRPAAMEPACWWEQSYQTVCERARVGGGQVCRPVPAGQPFLRCIGAGPQFPYRQNR